MLCLMDTEAAVIADMVKDMEAALVDNFRNIIIDKLRESLEPLSFIYAFWLEGADATFYVDEYSDIDFYVDFEDAYEAQAIDAVEEALSEIAQIDYKHVMQHPHPKIRQRIYHLAGTSEYLMIDFCWQLHSRDKNEYVFYENDIVEAAKVIFDKRGIIRQTPFNRADLIQKHCAPLAEAKYRRTQYLRAEKYVRREQYLEAYAYYQRYVFEPLVTLLRLIYTPAHVWHYLVHISQHIPDGERAKLEYFAQVGSLRDIAERIPQALEWFDVLAEAVDADNPC